MCFGEQTEITCDICRIVTVQETVWLGCHVHVLDDDDSYPRCPRPLVCKYSLTSSCLPCEFESTEIIDPEDEYPDYPDHPGFDDLKPVIEVTVIDLPPATDFKTIEALENLAGPADELPHYEDVPNEVLPPSYVLSEICYSGEYHEVADDAERYWEGLHEVANDYRKSIKALLWSLPVGRSLARDRLDFAYELIESFLLDAENLMLRINFLDMSLVELTRQHDEEWFTQSPVDTELLRHRGAAIIRELRNHLEQFNTPNFKPHHTRWDRRLKCLMQDISDQVDVENSERYLNDSRDLRAGDSADYGEREHSWTFK